MDVRGVVVGATLAAAVMLTNCGDDYSEAQPSTESDAGSSDAGDGDAGDGATDGSSTSEAGNDAMRDVETRVECAPSGCTPTCCLMRDAATPPACCGGNRAGWDIVLECAAPENCPLGQVCCLHHGTTQTIAECASKDECSNGGGAQMCDGDALDTECPSTLKCLAAPGVPAGYETCQFAN
jgi:hypothetical protein